MMSDAVLTLPPAAERTPEAMADADDRTDANRLIFPLATVIQIGVTVLSIGGAVWTVKADIQAIQTQIKAQQEIDAVRSQLQDERMANQREDITDMKRRLELVQIQYSSLREMMLESGVIKNSR